MPNVLDYFPNRVRAQCSTNSTDWQLVATDGVGYATYDALVAAGKTPFPGKPQDFPLGLPQMSVRTAASGGVTDGDTVTVLTNSLFTPTAEDDLISGSGQTLVYEDDAIKCLWVKKKTGTDIVIIAGYY